MFEELIEYINQKKINLNIKKGRNQLNKIIQLVIDNEGWDKSIKNIIEVFKASNWDNNTIQIILSYWHQFGDLDSIFCILTKYYLISKDNLIYLFEKLELSDLETILRKSIELKDNFNYQVLANNLISFYDRDLDGQTYLNLIEYTRNFQDKTKVNCKNIIDFFISKKSQYIYAPVPEWLSIEEGENLSLLMTLNPGKDYEDVEHEVNKLVKKAKDFFYVSQEIDIKEKVDQEEEFDNVQVKPQLNDALINYLTSSSLEESPGVAHKANRVFGPANRFIDKNCVSNPNKNGPCRMLECLCREVDEQDVYIYDSCEWFNGSCASYKCSRKIRDRSHCVRIPLEGGGWKGCYCSFECMSDCLPFRDEDMNFRIETMKASLHEDGIMDRTKT